MIVTASKMIWTKHVEYTMKEILPAKIISMLVVRDNIDSSIFNIFHQENKTWLPTDICKIIHPQVN